MAVTVFSNFSWLLLIALLLAILIQLLRQPPIIAYIFAGILSGPFFLQLTSGSELVELFAHLGVAFLLFMVGLNLNYTRVKEIGKTVLITGCAQVLITTLAGGGVAVMLGFTLTEALYIGVALAFSSTIIVVKLLADKSELDTLHGKISLGILLLQDLIVILVMTSLSTLGNVPVGSTSLIAMLARVATFLVLLWIFSKYALPPLLRFLAKSMDLLFLFSISWMVFLASMVAYLGLSMEIGALLAGIALATSPYQLEISSRVKFLKDFFIILFFVWLGMQMDITTLPQQLILAGVLTLFVIVGKPLIIMFILKKLKYTSRVGFSTGTALAQVSEFSIVLVLFGLSIGHLSNETISLITAVGLMSIITSTYGIKYSSKFYTLFMPMLSWFEPRESVKHIEENKNKKGTAYPVILFGHNRIGFSLVKAMIKKKTKFLVVDYNPEIIHYLEKEKIPCVYGDAGNIEVLENLALDKAKMIISTLPDVETNRLIIAKVKEVHKNKKIIIIVTAHQIEQALMLYKAGAHYVILPHFLGGRHVATLLEHYGFKAEKFIQEKMKHMEELHHRRRLGHEHPHNR